MKEVEHVDDRHGQENGHQGHLPVGEASFFARMYSVTFSWKRDGI